MEFTHIKSVELGLPSLPAASPWRQTPSLQGWNNGSVGTSSDNSCIQPVQLRFSDGWLKEKRDFFFFVKTKCDCISAQTYCVLVAVGGLIGLVVFMKGITDLCVCPKVGM